VLGKEWGRWDFSWWLHKSSLWDRIGNVVWVLKAIQATL
jgi:hypothetical protein